MNTPASSSYDYTLAPLAGEDGRFLDRRPGMRDVERLFPSSVSAQNGSLAVEGGVSLVAGPGMGKTSLLRRLEKRLSSERGLLTAFVEVPDADGYPDEGGFYGFLGELVSRIDVGLRAAAAQASSTFDGVTAALGDVPAYDIDQEGRAMSPRGFQRFIAGVAQAGVHTPGVVLLFDEVDHVVRATWKNAFLAALRFTFQTSAGITPFYGVWNLFGDESLPGSNYFRNVTRPIFFEPFAMGTEAEPGERRLLVQRGFPGLAPAAVAHVGRVAGGHPQLLQQVLGDLREALGAEDPARLATFSAIDVENVLGAARIRAEVALATSLLAATPALVKPLQMLISAPLPARALSRALFASGLLDSDENGMSCIPGRVRAAL